MITQNAAVDFLNPILQKGRVATIPKKLNERAKQFAPVKGQLLFRGRVFTKDDLEEIKLVARKYAAWGRWRISLIVCERLNWFQPNGWPKDRACRDALRSLESAGVISLPKVKIDHSKIPKTQDPVKKYYAPSSFKCDPCVRSPFSAILAKGNDSERIWNDLVKEHHYLGHKVCVGRNLKFLIYRDTLLVGGFSLSDASYNVSPRDSLLKILKLKRDEVVNNSRFLLLPRYSRPNDASQILRLLETCVANVWNKYYATTARLLETFVDETRFTGTCYKASNWKCIGRTKGFRKHGASFSNGQTSKLIFIRAADKHIAHRLVSALSHES